MSSNQFDLLKQRRFLPFFVTQSLGALNDNVFKNALITLITFSVISNDAAESGLLVNLAAVIFIFPFFLFSGTAGQLAEKYQKHLSIQKIKLFEIVVMMLACLGFFLQSVPFLLFVLFLMGLQSTLFGPIKYGILPQHLHTKELVGGNGLVEMGTFLAILIGQIIGVEFVSRFESGLIVVSGVVILIAIFGYLASRKIPYTPAVEPQLKVNWNPFTETIKNFGFMRRNRVVFLSVLGISWFWFFGATILTQLPNYAKHTLGGQAGVFTLLLTFFSLGIGIGSILCEKMSGRKIEIGLVPFGAIGMTLFTVDLYFANSTTDALPLMTNLEFMRAWQNWRVLIDSAFIGLFSGFYIVPLYALIQHRSEKHHVSRIIAGNNILNALFMVLSGIMAITLIQTGFSIPEIILITGILNAVISLYIFSLVPEFLMRFLVWIFVNIFYRIKLRGLEKIPEEGACVLVCNHVSFMDALIIAGCCRRPVRFVMDHRIFKTPIISFIFRTAKAIPIAPAKENPELMEKAFDQVAEYLEHGEVVCIFPEGRLTATGEMNEFKPGIERIIERTPVPVVPMALSGLWGSFFSRKDGPAMSSIPRRVRSKIKFSVGKLVQAQDVTANSLHKIVAELRGKQP
ncbi:MAG: MFS transporter [Gammaproteobacteria bacterium]|nr:MFS transporter [Gammaproteobacteria bacterium]